ncbi:NADPH-dependent F420 reductase [Amycolatopsis pigmentata]|uniref:NADPH-dependent F420 reductase n=1 Tax=Amycolatopsis pigmentata TaxID=450801 RepID=A0ABW5G6M5_9PSEU
MRIGIIGTGGIGANLARKLSAAGHAVRIANTRGPASITELAAESGVVATTLDEVHRGVEVLITSIPFGRVPDLKPIGDRLPDEVPVADTSNYLPSRDGRIEEMDSGTPQAVWIERQLGRPVVRAWNALVQTTLADKGRPPGAADRLALPVAGTDPAAKKLVMGLVDDTGFDPVDAGTVDDAWRMQAGTPAYCTELNAEQLQKALALADHDAARVRREAILAIIRSWEPSDAIFEDIVALNRTAAGLHRLLGPFRPSDSGASPTTRRTPGCS